MRGSSEAQVRSFVLLPYRDDAYLWQGALTDEGTLLPLKSFIQLGKTKGTNAFIVAIVSFVAFRTAQGNANMFWQIFNGNISKSPEN